MVKFTRPVQCVWSEEVLCGNAIPVLLLFMITDINMHFEKGIFEVLLTRIFHIFFHLGVGDSG